MTARKTLLLSQRDIAQCMRMSDYIEAVEGAFKSFAADRMTVPDVVHIAAPGGAFHIKSAAYKEAPSYVAVKVNGNFPGNQQQHGLPTIQGAIVLCDATNGSLLAVIDSIEVTAMRTAAATAVAARYLAQPATSVATIVGCGIQGAVQLEAVRTVLPIETVFAFDVDTERCTSFAKRMRSATGLDVRAAEGLGEATRASQLIVTCTSSREAYLRLEHVSPGTLVAAVGADNHDKQELDPDLMAHSRVVVDVLEQCATFGDLHHALAVGAMKRSDVAAELGEIVAGTAEVAFSGDDIVIFDSTGSAIQDVAAAGVIYERARATGAGTQIEFS